jgi:hypothetical protein
MNDFLIDEFEYPYVFLAAVKLGLVEHPPWHVVRGERLLSLHAGLRERFPSRSLVPFATRTDNDDVACWDLPGPRGSVVVIHDYASSGWELREHFADFTAWLHQAIDEQIDFDRPASDY